MHYTHFKFEVGNADERRDPMKPVDVSVGLYLQYGDKLLQCARGDYVYK